MSCEDLPVLSSQMIKDWRHEGRRSLVSRVRLGSTVAVLGDDALGSCDVRVWRRELPRAVQSFTAKALLIDKSYRDRVGAFFDPQHELTRKEEGLQVKHRYKPPRFLTPEGFAAAIDNPLIDLNLRLAFATYVFDTLSSVLSSSIYKGLALERCIKEYHYDESPLTHEDARTMFLMHFTDPGTPYPLDLAAVSTSMLAWRTAAGDFSVHGPLAAHSDSSKSYEPSGQFAPRLCLSFYATRALSP